MFIILVDQVKIIQIGIWSILGILAFLVIERVFPDDEQEHVIRSIKIMGILNLIANIVDNFTHGIAVAGSFQASHKVINKMK